MMLTKGEIESIDSANNTCFVRVPIFEGAGNTQRVSMLALISTPPCEDLGYVVGDVVFVAFAENSLNKPVIIGKLLKPPKYQDLNNQKFSGRVACSSLVVDNACQLPTSTILKQSGNAQENDGIGTVQAMIDLIKSQQTQIDSLKTELLALEERLSTIIPTKSDK